MGQSKKVKEAVAGHFRNPPGILDGSRSGLLPGNEGVNEAIQPQESSPVSFEDEMAKLERSAERLQQVFAETDAFKSIRNQIQIRMTPDGLEIQLTEKAKKVRLKGAVPTRGRTPKKFDSDRQGNWKDLQSSHDRWSHGPPSLLGRETLLELGAVLRPSQGARRVLVGTG